LRKLCSAALALVLGVLAATVSTSPSGTAGAAEPVVGFSPTSGVLFNNPDGTFAQQMLLLDELGRSIDAAPPGSVIRIATYSLSYQPTADKLLAAFARGVQVRLIIDSHAETDQIAQLRKKLGTSSSRTSYLRTCRYGCMSAKPSFLHTKLYMFSTSGKAKKVTMISSANPAGGGGTEAWNNTYTIVGDLAIYNANLSNFNDMLKDVTNPNYYRTASSGPYKVYFFPRGGVDRKSDTYNNVLNEVRCTGVAPGYGENGRTVIKIAMYRWTSLRKNLAQRLWQLQDQGCNVQIIYSADTVEQPVVAELLRSGGRNGRIGVYNGRLDRDGDGVLDLYIHSKYMLVNGAYGTRNNVKAVYTGSPNFTSNSLRESNETALRIGNDQVYDQFFANFKLIRGSYTVPVTKVPSPAVAQRQQGVYDAEGERTDDYWVSPEE